MAPDRHREQTAQPDTASDRRTPQNVVYVLTRDEVRSVDAAAVRDYGMPSIVLMENAARGLAASAIDMIKLGGDPPPRVVIVCGGGNNGGDGYAAARHLHNAGAMVELITLGKPRPETDAAINLEICRRMNLPARPAAEREGRIRADLLIDAIFGTGLDRDVTGDARDVIEWINAQGSPVLAVDIPSGLDGDTGRPLGVAVRATRTVTFVGWKPGFRSLDAQPFVGDIVVADIGVPKELIERYGRPLVPSSLDERRPLHSPPFASSSEERGRGDGTDGS